MYKTIWDDTTGGVLLTEEIPEDAAETNPALKS